MAEVAYYLLVIIGTIAFSLLVLNFISPDRYNLVWAIWDFYILKRVPRVLISRGIQTTPKRISIDRTGLYYLKQRLEHLEKEKRYHFEQWVLKDMIQSMEQYKVKFTGKHKSKLKLN